MPMKYSFRTVTKILTAQPVIEGAGVKLNRVFSNYEAEFMDPFLLLDHFGSDNPDDYLAGFPWHPHRGIETVTYMIAGQVEHGDSMGNKGVIDSGDIQWMTAGSGIIHQEMPKLFKGRMQGFQLWVNLPAKNKMMDPRYRGISSDAIPETKIGKAKIKVIAGELNGVRGPVRDIVADPMYLDVRLTAAETAVLPVTADHTAFVYVFEGEGYFDQVRKKKITSGNLALLSNGDTVNAVASGKGMRFILAAGKPIGETIAWRGPIVMNTQEELEIAFQEYYDGTFIKSK